MVDFQDESIPETDRAPMPDLIGRVVKAMLHGYMSIEDIHTMLLSEGLDEYQAYLTFIGAKMIYQAKLQALNDPSQKGRFDSCPRF